MHGQTQIKFISVRFCSPVELVPDTLLFKWTHKRKQQADRSGERAGRNCSHKLRYFRKSLL